MTAAELIAEIQRAVGMLGPTPDNTADTTVPVEIATSPRRDEWYEIANVTVEVNHRNNLVVVINTD